MLLIDISCMALVSKFQHIFFAYDETKSHRQQRKIICDVIRLSIPRKIVIVYLLETLPFGIFSQKQYLAR